MTVLWCSKELQWGPLLQTRNTIAMRHIAVRESSVGIMGGTIWGPSQSPVVVVVAEGPVSLCWPGWKEGAQAGASLHREDQRTVESSGTPPPRRGAATNPKVPGSPGIAGTQTHAGQCAPPAYSMGKSACRTGQRGAYNRWEKSRNQTSAEQGFFWFSSAAGFPSGFPRHYIYIFDI